MGRVTLQDALDLCALIAREKPEKFERAAIRWHGRLELEAGTLLLRESLGALAALTALPADPEQAVALLRRTLRRAQPLVVPRVL
jgi:hypothetical protein